MRTEAYDKQLAYEKAYATMTQGEFDSWYSDQQENGTQPIAFRAIDSPPPFSDDHEMQSKFNMWYHAYTAEMSDKDRNLVEKHIEQAKANALFNSTRWNNRAKRRNNSDRRLAKRDV